MLLLYPHEGGERTRWRLLGLGLLGGIGLLAKQHAIVPLGLLGLWHGFVLGRERAGWRTISRQLGALTLGAAVPLLIFALGYYLAVGALAPLLYWTLTFSLSNNYAALGVLGPSASDLKILVLIGLLVPVALFYAVRLARRRDPLYPLVGWGCLLLLGSSATLYPRYAAFHLQSALPVLAWLSGMAVAFLLDLKPPRLDARAIRIGRIALVGVLALIWLRFGGQRYGAALAGTPQQIGEYAELQAVAGEISQSIGPDSCFYLFPETEVVSNLYTILDCAPPDYWVMHYPWFMGAEIRRPALSALSAEQPAWIVSFSSVWELKSLAPEFYTYIDRNYQPFKQGDWDYGSYQIWRRIAP